MVLKCVIATPVKDDVSLTGHVGDIQLTLCVKYPPLVRLVTGLQLCVISAIVNV